MKTKNRLQKLQTHYKYITNRLQKFEKEKNCIIAWLLCSDMNVGGFPFDLNEPVAADTDMEDVIHHFDLNEPPEQETEGHTQQPSGNHHN